MNAGVRSSGELGRDRKNSGRQVSASLYGRGCEPAGSRARGRVSARRRGCQEARRAWRRRGQPDGAERGSRRGGLPASWSCSHAALPEAAGDPWLCPGVVRLRWGGGWWRAGGSWRGGAARLVLRVPGTRRGGPGRAGPGLGGAWVPAVVSVDLP